MTENNQILQAILELSSKMDVKFTELSERIDKLELRFDLLEQKVDKNHQTILNKLDQVEYRIGVLADEYITVKADVKKLKKVTGIYSDL
ncbi:hypothetical protein [Lysinibacillus endophyticus]|uniref:Uncharacterized protein n=1 Tax=Ureibacillus endophyticus TaxID=1978490 RepID=A0A494Z6D7_9BACL|nr:hypothetical protein [Lysinibacillus endophyticus]RKQ18125.1 hypothetical protein D8M03_06250 [Lysinibacillus endophyticus]